MMFVKPRRRKRKPGGKGPEVKQAEMKALVEALDKFPEARLAMIRVWDEDEEVESERPGAER